MSAALNDARPLDRAVVREAAQWLMRLHSGDATASDVEACQRWRAAHPEHERAWQRAERVNQKFDLVPREIALPALNRAQRVDRRAMLKTLVVAMTVAPASYLAWREWGDGWSADYQTATGERRSIELADGTRIQLNTASAMDVAFTDNQRRINLRGGEIAIETGSDSVFTGVNPDANHRPFIVETAHGSIRALGTRFVVRQGQGSDAAVSTIRVAVQQGAVEIRSKAAPDQAVRVEAGQQTRFASAGVDAAQPADSHAADWSRGVLFASNMRLSDFAVELGRYRSGLLRCDPAVAHLRITGAFQLNNTDNVLAALPDTLPVSVVYRTRWWVTIIPPQDKPGG